MWTRSAQRNPAQPVTVECWDYNGALFFKGEFATVAEADQAGRDAERRMAMAMQMDAAFGPLTEDEKNMSIEDIFAELGA